MATNLVIGWPEIPMAANAVDHSHTWGDSIRLNDYNNARCGHRYQLATLNAAVNATVTVGYDLGSGNTKTADFIIIARADLLLADDVTSVVLKGSNDSPTWATTTTVRTVTLGSETLIGPADNDAVNDFTTSSAFRYWKVEYNVSASSALTHSKVYFGNWFDFGDTVQDISAVKIEPGSDDFRSSSGAIHSARGRSPFYRVTCQWRGVSDDKVRYFFANIAHNQHSRRGVFLYTRNNHEVLDGHKLIHCKLVSASCPDQLDTDFNIIDAVFEELPG